MQTLAFSGAFSMASSQRSKWYINSNKDVPSAIYDVSSKQPTSMQSIGNGPRSQIVSAQCFPGPGEYENQPEDISKAKGIKIQGRLHIDPATDSVSPTQYHPKIDIVHKNIPSFPFAFRYIESYSLNTPGPDHYFRDTNRSLTASFRSTKRSRAHSFASSPAESQKEAAKFSHKLNKGFTLAEKLKTCTNNSPGIGQYDITTMYTAASTPTCTFQKGLRSHSYMDSITPGPGTFELRDDRPQGNRYSMGSSERPKPSVLFNNPGPGAYDPKKLPLEQRSGYVFGKQPNSAQKQFSRSPHRNEERLKEEERRRKKAVDTLQSRKVPNPGPSDYAQKGYFEKKAEEARIQGYTRDIAEQYVQPERFHDIKSASVPGPGQYEQDTKLVQKRSPTFKISEKQASTRDDSDEKPGPGEYSLSMVLTTVQPPSIRIGRSKRPSQVRNTLAVGPASYVPNSLEKTNKAFIGTGLRFGPLGDGKPGPGQYDISGDIGRLPSYMQKRNFKQRAEPYLHHYQPQQHYSINDDSNSISPEQYEQEEVEDQHQQTEHYELTQENYNNQVPEEELKESPNHIEEQQEQKEQKVEVISKEQDENSKMKLISQYFTKL